MHILFGIAAFWMIVQYSSTCLVRVKFTTTFSFHSQSMSKPHTFLLLYRLNMALTHKWWVLALRHQWCCCVFKFLGLCSRQLFAIWIENLFCVWPSCANWHFFFLVFQCLNTRTFVDFASARRFCESIRHANRGIKDGQTNGLFWSPMKMRN